MNLLLPILLSLSPAHGAQRKEAVATFAGGCFWCVEQAFEGHNGVYDVTSGYSGGHVKNPTYEQVCSETTGHQEAVQVRYDPDKITYEKLLDIFWRSIDPTDPGGQFADRGESYQTRIFTHSQEQAVAAQKSKMELAKSGRFDKPIWTPVVPFTNFYPAEDYHQDYYKKNPSRYKYYKWGSGRPAYLERIWGAQAHPAKDDKKDAEEKPKKGFFQRLFGG